MQLVKEPQHPLGSSCLTSGSSPYASIELGSSLGQRAWRHARVTEVRGRGAPRVQRSAAGARPGRVWGRCYVRWIAKLISGWLCAVRGVCVELFRRAYRGLPTFRRHRSRRDVIGFDPSDVSMSTSGNLCTFGNFLHFYLQGQGISCCAEHSCATEADVNYRVRDNILISVEQIFPLPDIFPTAAIFNLTMHRLARNRDSSNKFPLGGGITHINRRVTHLPLW